MPSSLLTNLNSAFSLSFPRAVIAKEARDLVKALTSHSSRLCDNSRMTASAAAAGGGTTTADLVVDSSASSSYGNVSGFAKPSGLSFGNKRVWSCRRGSLSMTSLGDRSRSNSCVRNWNGSCFAFDVTWRAGDNGSTVRLWSGGVGGRNGNVSWRCYSEGTVPQFSGDDSSSGDLPGGLAVSDERRTLGDGALKLLSGSCYLPHPDKEKTGGEDAHFICSEEQVIGVADGVGGWADHGIDAGDYARVLMSNSVDAIRHEPKGFIDLAHVLEKAYERTTKLGSSTACIVALTEQGLHAINLGDSGFIVVRDGRTIFESPVQVHGFNFPFQLESGNRADPPSSGQVFTIPVVPGDVIVAGTDGLFDNLFNNEVSSTVAHAVLAGFTPDTTAQKIAALARQRALDKQRQTPFSVAAQEAGLHYYGGKLDDITVVVSYVTS